jgi:integrase/recombinase XerC
MTMEEAIRRFILAKRSENLSPSTIRAYKADLFELSKFMGLQQGPELLSREVVRAFLAMMHRLGTSKKTAIRRLSAIKSLVRWGVLENVITEDNFDRITTIKRPKSPIKLPQIPSEQEMAILLDGDFPTAFPERDRLLLELMYGSGLRVSEAAHIRVDDLRPEQSAILINGKGGPYGKSAKYRLVPLGAKSREALAGYLPVRDRMLNQNGTKTAALFFRVRGKNVKRAAGVLPINVRSVHRLVRYMSQVRGLVVMHPHLLRHACATHMLDHGCPLDVIQHILGHDRLDVTAHYAQVSTRLMMREYNYAHPHALKIPA